MSIFNLAAFSEDLSRLRRAAFEATAAYALAPLTRQPLIACCTRPRKCRTFLTGSKISESSDATIIRAVGQERHQLDDRDGSHIWE